MRDSTDYCLLLLFLFLDFLAAEERVIRLDKLVGAVFTRFFSGLVAVSGVSGVFGAGRFFSADCVACTPQQNRLLCATCTSLETEFFSVH